MGGWDIFSYLLFFIYGYLLFASPRTGETLRKYCFVSLGMALVVGIFLLAMRYVVLPASGTGFFFSTELRSLLAWLFIMAFLGLGGRYLTANSKFLAHANEAVLPFYILHQPVILFIGYFVVQWTLPIAAKYFIIAGTSFVVIIALYELLVRQLNALRFIFGMRLTRRSDKPNRAG